MKLAHAKFLLCDSIRPVLRRTPRGSIRLLSLCGGGKQDDPDWIDAPRRYRSFFDKQIGALVAVDLADWGGRWHYYTARYYDRRNQLLIKQTLGPGDTYIDVGANLGIHTLLASKSVGPNGHVYSFEPHPGTFELLKAHLAMNHIRNVKAHNLALSDECGTAIMRVAGTHSGRATLRSEMNVGSAFQVTVSTGDKVLSALPTSGTILLKIDVEGFELKVLSGMTEFLGQTHPIIMTEITPSWIEQTGGRASDLIELLETIGYRAYEPVLLWKWGLMPILSFRPLESLGTSQTDVLFVYASSDRRSQTTRQYDSLFSRG